MLLGRGSESMQDTQAVARRLLLEAIPQIVASAQADGGMLRIAEHAAMLFAAYPAANLSMGRIVDELVAAAAAAGVPVEISRPE